MTQEPTAGRYGWESNVFQVGGLMACFITGEVSQYPPEARPFQLQGANGNTELAWTYGGRCMDDEFGDIDVNLRSLVAWCMGMFPPSRLSSCVILFVICCWGVFFFPPLFSFWLRLTRWQCTDQAKDHTCTSWRTKYGGT